MTDIMAKAVEAAYAAYDSNHEDMEAAVQAALKVLLPEEQDVYPIVHDDTLTETQSLGIGFNVCLSETRKRAGME